MPADFLLTTSAFYLLGRMSNKQTSPQGAQYNTVGESYGGAIPAGEVVRDGRTFMIFEMDPPIKRGCREGESRNEEHTELDRK